MRGHQRETNQRVLRRAGWRYHGVDEHTVVKSQLGHHESLVDVSHIQRDDGTLGLTNLEALFPVSLQGVAGNLPKALYALRLILDDVQGLARGSRGGRRVRGAEDVSAAGMAQIVDGVAVRGDEAADGSQALREGPHDEVNLAGQPEMVTHATTLTAKDPQSVRLVNHDGTVIPVFQLDDGGQIGQITLHGEHSVYHDQLHGLAGKLLQQPLQVGHVVMLVPQLRGEGQAASVHDAGMVTVVTDDVVVAAHHHGQHALVDGEPGREAQGLVLSHEGGQFFLQPHVKVKRAIEESASGTARAILVQGLLGRADDALIPSQSRISVGAEHQHAVTAHLHFSALLAGYFPEIRIHAGIHVLLRLSVILVSFL